MLAVPDTARRLGARDKALLQLRYNSGARVALTGKGGKTRAIPPWPQTVQTIDHDLLMRQHAGIQSERLFVNIKARPMTRCGLEGGNAVRPIY